MVKVADFGLSRDLYFRDYYRISDRMTPLPVRWMAPESLQTNIFKLESDVVRNIAKSLTHLCNVVNVHDVLIKDLSGLHLYLLSHG